MIKRFGWVSCVVFLGCGGGYLVTSTGEAQYPREEMCEYDILTASPFTGYREIGTIDIQPGAQVHLTDSLTVLKDSIRPEVCRLGGDAAVAVARGDGSYIKATVLKRAGAPASDPAVAPSSGCAFDTQCKGDRICVAGQCQAPPADAAPKPAQ